jgi:DNA-binding XRE family transcriptional regulator
VFLDWSLLGKIGLDTKMANGSRGFRTDEAPLHEQLDISARRIKFYLAQNVTLARHRAGLTQLQLAKAAELSRATVHLIEAGICDARLSTVARLAEALGINALDLLAKEAPANLPGGAVG